jgi:hypothetical protein
MAQGYLVPWQAMTAGRLQTMQILKWISHLRAGAAVTVRTYTAADAQPHSETNNVFNYDKEVVAGPTCRDRSKRDCKKWLKLAGQRSPHREAHRKTT